MKTIYALHAGDGVIRYVGQTGQPLPRRLSEHKSRSRTLKTDLHRWVQEIGPANLCIVLLEECDDDVAQDREYDYIDQIPNLVNGWRRDMPDWMRAKIGASVGEHLRTNGHPWSGKHHSEETRRKISEATMGRTPWNKKVI